MRRPRLFRTCLLSSPLPLSYTFRRHQKHANAPSLPGTVCHTPSLLQRNMLCSKADCFASLYLRESGTFTSIVAAATIISASVKLDSNVCLLFVFVLGRVYGCTFLYNLNIRQNAGGLPGNSSGSAGPSSGPTFGSKGASNRVDTLHLNALSRAEQTVAGIEDAGVNVQRDTTIYVDTASMVCPDSGIRYSCNAATILISAFFILRSLPKTIRRTCVFEGALV